ncbi:MAG TPA: hypothetical protein ENO31_01435 [Thermoprotei archaeon]|nr:hypothetical protein [Thermoprotei archaeon]
MKKRLFLESCVVLLMVLAGVSFCLFYPKSYVRPGLSLQYNETVGLKNSPTNVEFNISVTRVKGQFIYFNYTVMGALNATFSHPVTTQNITAFFDPFYNYTYVAIEYFGLPLFVSGLHDGMGSTIVKLSGIPFNASYSVIGTYVSVNLTSLIKKEGIPVITMVFAGNYNSHGILVDCNVTSVSEGISVYETVKLISEFMK